MKIIAHRGYWIESTEKNTESAFIRAWENGFGIETDFRDNDHRLIISHDPGSASSLSANKFFELNQKYNSKNSILAINAKSDGLQNLLNEYVNNFQLTNYFVFDMSIPDTLAYAKKEITFFTRASEYEMPPALLMKSEGVWLDAFESRWYDEKTISTLLSKKKKIAIVSAELHGRECMEQWAFLKLTGLHLNPLISLCTDFPMQAKEYFHAQN